MRVLLCFVLGALLLSADVVDAKKKKKKAKKKSSRVVKSTANVAIENQLADIAQMTHLVDQIDALDRLIVQKPKEPRYWLARGQARLKKDFLPSAMKDFDQVISLDPEFEGPGRLAMVSKADILKRKPEGLSTALQLMVTLAEELDQPFYEGVMKRCELLARMQKWADAIPLCGDIIDSPHKDDYSWNDDALGWAYFYRAQAYEAQHSFKQARTDYDGCIASWAHLPPLNKGNVVNATVAQRQLRTAHFNRADLRCAGQCGFNGAGAGSPTAELRDEIDMDGAVADYEVVANHALTQPGSTNHAVTCARLGLAMLKQKEDSSAVKYFSEAIGGYDKELGWWLNRGLAYARLDKWKESIADYTQAIEIAPKSATAYTNRGIIYQRRRMWPEAIADFTLGVRHGDSAQKGDALAHRGFCYLKAGERTKAYKDVRTSCKTHKMEYSCQYSSDDTLDQIDLNDGLAELPGREADQEEEQEEDEDEEDEEEEEEAPEEGSWLPVGALTQESESELAAGCAGRGGGNGCRGARVTVGALARLQAAWQRYDEWSVEYSWQAEQSGTVVRMDEDDGTVLVDFAAKEEQDEGEAAGAKEKDAAVPPPSPPPSPPKAKNGGFEKAQIKHIKDKTLTPFRKKFKSAVVLYYRPDELCGHCAAVKPVFAQVADWVMARNKDRAFSFAAIDCGHVKAQAKPLCDGIWTAHQSIDANGHGKHAPRVVYYKHGVAWEDGGGLAFVDPMAMGEHPGHFRKWLVDQGLESAQLTKADKEEL